VLQDFEEMGAVALRMMKAAIESLARRDLELARELPEMDDPIDKAGTRLAKHGFPRSPLTVSSEAMCSVV
jgi:phosphate uptake regulator